MVMVLPTVSIFLGILVDPQRSLLVVEREGRTIRVIVYRGLRVLRNP